MSTRIRLKNRIHATLAKYGLPATAVSDLLGMRGRELLAGKLTHLPPHTRYATEQLLEQLDVLDEQIADLEECIRELFTTTPNSD
jgi:transposase